MPKALEIPLVASDSEQHPANGEPDTAPVEPSQPAAAEPPQPAPAEPPQPAPVEPPQPAPTGALPELRTPASTSYGDQIVSSPMLFAASIISSVFLTIWLLVSLPEIQNEADEANQRLRDSCLGIRRSAAAATNAMAEGTSRAIEKSTLESLDAARGTMVFSLVILQRIIEFALGSFRAILTAFMELTVSGSWAAILALKMAIYAYINEALNTLRSSIASFISLVKSYLPTSFQSKVKFPNLDALELDGSNAKVPTAVQDMFTDLNRRVATMGEWPKKENPAINIPFTKLKKQINTSFTRLHFTAPALPPTNEHEFTFCDSLKDSIVNNLASALKWSKIWPAVLVTSFLLFVVVVAYLVRRSAERNRFKVGGVKDARNQTFPQTTSQTEPMVFLSMQNPFPTSAAHYLVNTLRLPSTAHTHVTVFLAYIWHPLALACLLTGLVGSVTVKIQTIVSTPLRGKYASVAHDWANSLSPFIMDQINVVVMKQSSTFVKLTNARVEALQGSVDGIVADWVNGTVTHINKLIAVFYRDLRDSVGKVFADTFFEDSARNFLRHVVKTQSRGIESALPFIQEHFQIKIPQFGSGALVLGDATVRQIAETFVQDVVGPDGERGVVAQMMDQYMVTLKREQMMFRVLLILGGLMFAFIYWASYRGRAQHEGRQGRVREANSHLPPPGVLGSDNDPTPSKTDTSGRPSGDQPIPGPIAPQYPEAPFSTASSDTALNVAGASPDLKNQTGTKLLRRKAQALDESP